MQLPCSLACSARTSTENIFAQPESLCRQNEYSVQAEHPCRQVAVSMSAVRDESVRILSPRKSPESPCRQKEHSLQERPCRQVWQHVRCPRRAQAVANGAVPDSACCAEAVIKSQDVEPRVCPFNNFNTSGRNSQFTYSQHSVKVQSTLQPSMQ